ncbi:MAG TPA: DUF1810 family protein [Kofleriaceae bacterium]|nr:DUF1810 family protein [Kofleriaceae bacterium]
MARRPVRGVVLARGAPGLARFHEAQAASWPGFDAALRELHDGRKTGHWIWWVFPQLRGLGQSHNSTYYGIVGVEEAADYLRDSVLGERLVEAAAVVRSHLTGPRSLGLETLMGGMTDAQKLVSCMTLFRHVAHRLGGEPPLPRFAIMAGHADAILAVAAAQGHPPCRFTEESIRRSPAS